MIRLFSVLCVLGALFASADGCCDSCGAAEAAEKVSLFNGKDFSGWRFYINENAKDVKPEDIWSIEDGVIRCRGHVPGYIITDKEYDNYVLRFQWKWGDGVARGRNSGCFVHTVGPDKIWPKAVEAQLMADHAGDIWLVDGAQLNIDKDRQDQGTPRHYYRLEPSAEIEKPLGEWNQYEITCDGDTITLVINGHLVNEGTDAELTRGRILLQSEGAEIFFRNIELEPLEK